MGRVCRLPAVLVLLALLLCSMALAEGVQVHFLDVGQADAILILEESGGIRRAMMIDTGDRKTARQVTAYVREQGVTQLEWLVLTHPHADHIGGAAYLMESLPVGSCLLPPVETTTAIYGRVAQHLEEYAISRAYPGPGDRFFLGCAVFTVMAPHPVAYPLANDWSIVLMMEVAGRRVLFTGDAQVRSEEDMLAFREQLPLRADVLKVGHHGSDTSSSYGFVQAVSPEIAVVSCGKDEQREYPMEDVWQNLLDAGVSRVYLTRMQGTVVLEIRPDGEMRVTTER